MGGITLAIDTVADACSVALIEDDRVVDRAHEIVGRGHAERLAPMVAALVGGHPRPVRVLVDCGPGSFTGVRVGLAAAIGLGLGWGVPVLGFSSLASLAAAALSEDESLSGCGVAIAGGHGELFVQRFDARPFAATMPVASLAPSAAAAVVTDAIVVGGGAEALVAARGTGEARTRLPDAAAARLLSPGFHLPPRPVYGRAPDAKPVAA